MTRDPRNRIRRLKAEIGDRAAAWRAHRRTVAAMLPPPRGAWASIGNGTVVVPPTRIESPECISIGEAGVVNEHAWLCILHLPDLAQPQLRIGDRVLINRFAKIVCAARIDIGDDVVIGDRFYCSDVEHLPWTGDSPTAPLSDPKPVTIGDRVLISIGVTVKPGVTIGADAYVGAGSYVDADVPPATLVAGNPARPLRARSGDDGPWLPV